MMSKSANLLIVQIQGLTLSSSLKGSTTAIGCFSGLEIVPNPKFGRYFWMLLPDNDWSKENPMRDVPMRK